MTDCPEPNGPERWTGIRSLPILLTTALVVGCGDPTPDAAVDVEAPPDYDYGTTLSRFPVDFDTQSQIWGSGQVTARVLGDQLFVEGEFTDVESSVTGAYIHRARPGLRGPRVDSLEVVAEGEERAGTVAGAIQITEEVREALAENELYVQIHSEANPDGVLRGWLYPPRRTFPPR